MTLVKTSLLTAVSTIVKMIAGLIVNKILAIYVGPAGLAIIGQLQNFISIVGTFSNGAITQGIVKYTAEFKNIKEKQKIFSTSVITSIVCSSIVSIFLILFSSELSQWILKTERYKEVFIVFGFSVFFYALNLVFLAILNGQKEIKKYVLVNILSSVSSLILISILTIKFKLLGALYALVLNQVVVFLITLFILTKNDWFRTEHFLQGIDITTFKKLSKFSLMSLTSAFVVPTSYIIVRNYIGSNLGWENAGFWQGVFYVSNVYLTVVLTALGVYYLPRLSEIKNKKDIEKEIIYGYKIVIPIVIVFAFVIYIFRELIIKILFSEEFIPMAEFFKWQLLGDIVKISSWLLGNIIIAKAFVYIFIPKEIFMSVLFVGLSLSLIKLSGLVGVFYAYIILYILNLLFNFLIVKYYIWDRL